MNEKSRQPEKITVKKEWNKPELYILDFKNTSTGPLTDPVEDEGLYSGTQVGS